MATKFEDKEAATAGIDEATKAAPSAIVADVYSAAIGAMTGLREEAREAGVCVRVIRNILFKRAAEGTQFGMLSDVFKGLTLITFSSEHPGAAARIFREFTKGWNKFEIRVATFEDQFLAANQIDVLVNLSTYDGAISQLISVIQSTTSKLTRTLAVIHDRKGATVT